MALLALRMRLQATRLSSESIDVSGFDEEGLSAFIASLPCMTALNSPAPQAVLPS
jgi:hypothetical protein